MNAEMLTDFLNTYHFLRCVACCEYQLRQACCDATELNKPIDALARLQAIGIEAEVLFGISKGGFYVPPLAIVCHDLGYLKRQIEYLLSRKGGPFLLSFQNSCVFMKGYLFFCFFAL